MKRVTALSVYLSSILLTIMLSESISQYGMLVPIH